MARQSRFGDREGSARATRMRGAGYRHMLRFQRVFTKGPWAGDVQHDALPFVTADDARDWIRDVNAAAKHGKIDYRVTRATIEVL